MTTSRCSHLPEVLPDCTSPATPVVKTVEDCSSLVNGQPQYVMQVSAKDGQLLSTVVRTLATQRYGQSVVLNSRHVWLLIQRCWRSKGKERRGCWLQDLSLCSPTWDFIFKARLSTVFILVRLEATVLHAPLSVTLSRLHAQLALLEHSSFEFRMNFVS